MVHFGLREQRVPKTTRLEKYHQLDILGNFVFIGAALSLGLALTLDPDWASARTLLPLIFSILAFAAWVVYEKRLKAPILPILPFEIFETRNACFALVADACFWTWWGSTLA